MADKDQTAIILPDGRLINGSLFVKDAYKGDKENSKPSVPKYKIEVAFDKDDKEFDKVIGEVEAAAKAKYGKNSILDIDARDGDDEADIVVSGIIDGDRLARKREKKGKEGDAYKGKWVIRSSTIFNLHGEDGPGGIEIYDEEVKPIAPVDKNLVYNGCMIAAKTVLGYYQDSKTDANSINWYLKSVQKVGDGARLTSQQDNASAFTKRAGSSTRGRSRDDDAPRSRSRGEDNDDAPRGRSREEAPARGRDRDEPPARSRGRGEEDEAPRSRSRGEEPEERSTSRRR